jgi:ATP-dependent RNA helicase DDX5/DBP2
VTGLSPDGRSNYDVPAHLQSFEQTPFGKPIMQAIQKAGFTAPTATQAQTWPICLQGRDVISIAKTGSGKTCGFLIPAFYLLQQSREQKPSAADGERAKAEAWRLRMESYSQCATTQVGSVAPKILVMAPTRELACQISDEAKKFGHGSGIKSVCLYGGTPKKEQIKQLHRTKPSIIIATPGRLNDLLDIKSADVSEVDFLVLDEADRMLDMGFAPQIRSVIKRLPRTRQTMFFSATWPKEVRKLASEFLTNPVQVNVGDSTKLNANKCVTQHVAVVETKQKKVELVRLLARLIKESPNPEEHRKIVIFTSKKHTCAKLAEQLWNSGKRCDCLHGDREQWERTEVMNKFKNGKLRVLVATDVAARGLDVKDVEVVVNFDFPVGKNGVADYVHRIGRTGRAGKTGEEVRIRGERNHASRADVHEETVLSDPRTHMHISPLPALHSCPPCAPAHPPDLLSALHSCSLRRVFHFLYSCRRARRSQTRRDHEGGRPVDPGGSGCNGFNIWRFQKGRRQGRQQGQRQRRQRTVRPQAQRWEEGAGASLGEHHLAIRGQNSSEERWQGGIGWAGAGATCVAHRKLNAAGAVVEAAAAAPSPASRCRGESSCMTGAGGQAGQMKYTTHPRR